MNRIRTTLLLAATASLLVITPARAATKEAPSALDVARQLNQAFVEVAEKVSPSVVVIRVAHKADHMDMSSLGIDEDNPLYEFFRKQLEEEMRRRRSQQERRERMSQEPVFDSQGSGIVLREDGFIMTNNHVVEGAEKIKVRMKDGKEYDAVVRGTDKQSDLAVLKVNATGLPVAKLGDSSKTRVGEFTIAIGTPFELDYSVTFGHVSAKGRRLFSDRVMWDQDFIQTDASINPGNSGGPLFNIEGEVIGINTLIRGMNSGIGFAVPSNLVREITDRLIEGGKFTRAWLGVGIETLSEQKDLLAMVKGVKDGVVVRSIMPNGPSAKSELEPLDIIVAVDGRTVASAQDLKAEIRTKKIGQPVTLDVYRLDDKKEGKRVKVKVSPGELPEETLASAPKRPKGEGATEFGMTVKPLTKELATEYGIEVQPGVIVTEVEAGSAAEARGIQPGDIINRINRRPVTTLQEFRNLMKAADPQRGISLSIINENGRRFEILKESGK